MNLLLAELLGTMMLVWLGDGVVANVLLAKSGMKGAGPVQITLAWAAAVMVPATIFARVSGAHFNPALTIALAMKSGDWSNVPIYIIGQMIGGFIGAVLVYIQFKPHYDAEENPGTILGTFSTGPSIPNTSGNFISEMFATFVLVFALMNFPAAADGVGMIFVYVIIMSLGMSFGGVTGYALNPARDFAPRLAHAVLPIKNKGDSNWGYSWIPVVAPICGAIVASLVSMGIAWIF